MPTGGQADWARNPRREPPAVGVWDMLLIRTGTVVVLIASAVLTVMAVRGAYQLPVWAVPLQTAVFVLLVWRCHQLMQGAPRYYRFPVNLYLRELGKARDTAKILDTYSTLFWDTSRRQDFVDRFRKLVEGGGRVQVLLLDADSADAAERMEALRGELPASEYEERMEANLRELYLLRQSLSSSARDRFQVRLIESFPGITCYQVDNYILTSLYPPVQRACEAPQLWVRRDSAVGWLVQRRFDDLWGASTDFLPRMSRDVEFSPAGTGRAVLAETRFVGYNGTLYLALEDLDLAEQAERQHLVEVLVPDEDDRVRKRYRARVVSQDQDPDVREHERVAYALHRKYGDLVNGHAIFALALSDPAGALPPPIGC
jgi:hypothetical protein